MASSRDISHRIKSVRSTQQITKAMNLVAASKLHKARARMTETKPFFKETCRVIAEVALASQGLVHPHLTNRIVNNSLYIVIAGERGLCGGYNGNVNRLAIEDMNSKKSAEVITIGAKANEFFRRRGKSIIQSYSGISENPFYDDVLDIGTLIFDKFDSGEVDEVCLVYTEFHSPIYQKPKILKLLPVDTALFENAEGDNRQIMSYEPDTESVLNYIIPKYVNTVIFSALIEAAACELGSRMTAMDAATVNADDMIESLTIKYNRARQGAITQEISEIVGSADTLG